MEGMSALHINGTWKRVSLPFGKTTVKCCWVYIVKVSPSGKVDRLKARLIVKGYAQISEIDFGEIFSSVAKIASIRLLLSLATIHHGTLH